MAKAVFRHIWEPRRAQAKDIISTGKREVTGIDKEIDAVLDQIMSASNDTIIWRQ